MTWKTEHVEVFHVLLLFEHNSKNLGSRRVKCRTDPLGGFVEPLYKHLLIGEEAQMPRAFFIAREPDLNNSLTNSSCLNLTDVTLVGEDTYSKVLMLLLMNFLSKEALITA